MRDSSGEKECLLICILGSGRGPKEVPVLKHGVAVGKGTHLVFQHLIVDAKVRVQESK